MRFLGSLRPYWLATFFQGLACLGIWVACLAVLLGSPVCEGARQQAAREILAVPLPETFRVQGSRAQAEQLDRLMAAAAEGEEVCARVRQFLRQRLRGASARQLQEELAFILAALTADFNGIGRDFGLGWSEAQLGRRVEEAWRSIVGDIGGLNGKEAIYHEEPLVGELLNTPELGERQAKFELLVHWGAFLPEPGMRAAGWGWEPLSYGYLQRYVIEAGPHAGAELLGIWQSFLLAPPILPWLWDAKATEAFRGQQKFWLAQHGHDLLQGLLVHGHYRAACSLLENLGGGAYDPMASADPMMVAGYPYLERVLKYLERKQRQFNALSERADELSHLLATIGEPFTESGLAYLQRLAMRQPELLSLAQWELARLYCSAGYVRNYLLAQIGAAFSQRFYRGYQGTKDLLGLLRALSQDQDHMAQLSLYHGLDVALRSPGADGYDILSATISKRAGFALGLLLAKIDKKTWISNQGKPPFVLLFAGLSQTEAREGCNASEQAVLASVRVLLKAFQRYPEELIKALEQVDDRGKAPLQLAAEHGQYRVFKLLQRTAAALQPDRYGEALPSMVAAEAQLLKGLRQRRRREPSSALAGVAARIQSRLLRAQTHSKALLKRDGHVSGS